MSSNLTSSAVCYNFAVARPSFKIEWDAPEHEHKLRSEDWFWAVGIIALASAVAAIIFGDVIFGILIILSAFSLSLFINRSPELVHIVVDERGIIKGKTLYPYNTLHSFWVDPERSHPVILLRSQKMFMPLIHIPLDPDTNLDRLERAMLQHLPTEYYGHHIAERVLEYLGF